jgi:hypothetical protein
MSMKRILFLSFFLLLSACGPTVQVKFTERVSQFERLALLPVVSKEPLRMKRKMLISHFLRTELESRGYRVLLPDLLSDICQSTQDCLEKRSDIFAHYPIDGLLLVTVQDLSGGDFGLGFYQSLSAEMKVLGKNGNTLFQLEDSVINRGGLVFESGQVFEGLRQQIGFGSDLGFQNLAKSFAKDIMQEFPLAQRPEGEAPLEEDASAPTLQTKEVLPGVFELCVPKKNARQPILIAQGVRSFFQSASDKEDCLRLSDDVLQQATALEYRHAFGGGLRIPYSFALHEKKHIQ